MEETLSRAGMYRYFATVFRYPEPEEWEFINDLAGEARACLVDLRMPTGAFDEFVAELGRHTREEAEPIYVRTFLNGIPGAVAPPYESLYVADTTRLRVLAAVNDSYERCGVGLSDDFPDMPDHIATELEFMQYLCLEEGAAPAFQPVISASAREFLAEHLVPFVQAISTVLPEGLYNHAARALQSFVDGELRS
jgi:TorA maturation chaperone TorD